MPRRPRRLLLLAGRDPRREISGGHSAFVRAHARAAQAIGFEPVLLCVGETAEREKTDFGEVVRVASPGRALRQTHAAFHARRLGVEIERQVVDEEAVPFVHGFGLWSAGALTAQRRLAARAIDLRFTVSLYTTYLEQARSQRRGLVRQHSPGAWALTLGEELWILLACHRLERRVLRAASRLWVNYDHVARLVRKSHGMDLPIRRLPYAPETAFLFDRSESEVRAERHAADHGDPRPLVLSVARQDPRKANEILVSALGRLRRESVPFRAVLAGGGRLLDDIRALVASHDLAGAVSVPGVVADLRPLWPQADVFVLSTRAEQSGSVAVLEAMQMGLPIVATGVDGLLEDLTDERDALLVPPRDIEALTTALRRLLTDGALGGRLGKEARRTFERRFSADAFTRRLAGAYAELDVEP